MADLRIVDAPVLLQESITDDVKMPTGGLGNFSIRLGDIVWYVVTKEQLANKNYVDLSSKGVKDSLDIHIADKNNPHKVTKEHVGLGNVDNTADVDKPVSNAVNSAIITATTDMATKTYVNSKDGDLSALLTTDKTSLVKAINEVVSVKANKDAVALNISNLTNNKADKSTTLEGYGITDAYTKSEIDANYGGVKYLYDKNVEAGAGANGWTDLLIKLANGRTQRDKNQDFITTKDFGCVGDGVTDDSANLQKAIDFAQTNKRPLDGLGLTYACNNVLFDSNLHFKNANLICNKFDTDLISVLNAKDTSDTLSNVYFENIKINGKRELHTKIRDISSSEDGARHGFRFFRKIDGVLLVNCEANNCATDGIELFCRQDYIKNFVAIDCKFNGNRRHGGSGDSLDGVKFIRCEFNNNGTDLPQATGTRDNKLGIWGDRPGGKIYTVGFDIEEYAGFTSSKNVAFDDCNFVGNSYGAVTIYRTDDYTTQTTPNNITIRGGKLGKGIHNGAMSLEISPFAPWPYYNKAFLDILIDNVDFDGGDLYLRYGTITLKNIKNYGTLHIHGRSVAHLDRDYNVDNSESSIYVASVGVDKVRTYSSKPISRLQGVDNTSPTIELYANEAVSTGTSIISHLVGGDVRGQLRFDMDGFWGTTIFKFVTSDASRGLILHPYLKYLVPVTDNDFDLGSAANRFANVYAGTGTINTSDERLKTNFTSISDAEKQAALEIKQSIKRYQFTDSVDAKGDKARYHWGVGAQTVTSIMAKHGLDANDYGFFCYDEWEAQDEVLDDEGNIVSQKVEAGNRYGIRYDELIMFILACI